MNDGGPAFPVQTYDTTLEGQVVRATDYGMTLRDYFAAKAMQAFICKPGTINNKINVEDYEYAQFAYRLADCMISQRSK